MTDNLNTGLPLKMSQSEDWAEITTIGVDADDTIWHNENKFQEIYDLHHEIVRAYAPDNPDVIAQLLRVEKKNLGHYGYGAKGLMLSVIESVLEVTRNQVRGDQIARIIEVYHRHLSEAPQVIDGVRETLERLNERYSLLLITKGDYIEQSAKIRSTGIGALFAQIHIVPEKDPETYRKILADCCVEPRNFLMVGNSTRSDIFPVLSIGGSAIHIPYHLTWEHEAETQGVADVGRAQVLARFADLPRLLRL